MFNGIREKLGKIFIGSEVQDLQETISLLQIKMEDEVWKNINTLSYDKEFSPSDLKEIRATSLLYYHKNPMVKQAIRLVTEFVFANGVSMPKSSNDKIQDAIKELWNNEQNQAELFSFTSQLEKSDDLQINGELYLVLFTGEKTKETEIASIDADEITEIITDDENKKKVLWYKRTYFKQEFSYENGKYETGRQETKYYRDWKNESEDIPEGLKEEQIAEGVIYHVKINSVRSKHGISEVYVILGWARAHKRMIENLATFSKAKSIFAWKKKLLKGAKAQLDTLKNTYDAKTNLSNPSTATASTIIENQAIDNQGIEYKTGAGDWEKDIRQMVLPIAAGSGFSEQYFGNPSTANLAIGDKLELPLLKKIERWQKLWENIYINIIKYSLEKRGVKFQETDVSDVTKNKSIIFDVDIDFPPIVVHDIENYMKSLEIGKRIGGIDQEEIEFKTLTILGVNNINAVMERMQKERGKKEKEELTMQVPPVMAPQAQAFGAGALEAVARMSKLIKEAEDKNNGND